MITCYSFMQEPFKSLPLIWTIHEKALAARLRKYTSDGQIELINDWKKTFNRATVVVFPNYILPVKFISYFYCPNWCLVFFSFNLKLDCVDHVKELNLIMFKILIKCVI